MGIEVTLRRIAGCGLLPLCVFLSAASSAEEEAADLKAWAILGATGVQGGLVVLVECGDGRLAAALRMNEGFVVHGLCRDTTQLEAARAHLRSLGVYGGVSVDRWREEGLPYADNLVNLLVIDGASSVAREEILRVLAPRGVAVWSEMKDEQGSMKKLLKPWPDSIDEWPQYLHGPDNNAVAKDSVVGPPQHMQWVNGPTYARSHEINSSMAAMVSGGGRLFYIWDEGPSALTDSRFPPRWSLIARDAFNGITLWKRPMPQWGWREWHAVSRWDDRLERAKMLRYLPPTLPRRLVAAGDRLYVTLGYEAPVSELNAATGEVVREFEGTAWTDEIVCDGDLLVLRVRVADSPPDKDVWDTMPRQSGKVMALDARNNRILWESKPEPFAPLTLATQGGKVFYSNYDQVVCLDREAGKEMWRSIGVSDRTSRRGTGGTLVAYNDVVLYACVPEAGGGGAGELHTFSATTGEHLWTGPTFAGPGGANPPDLFVVDNLVWVGETSLPVDVMGTVLDRKGLDPVTGEVRREVNVPKLISPGHHYRCYRSKATERYLLLPKRGVEFVDVEGQDHMRNDWLRAPCIYGMLPSNGLLYVAPHQCVCYPGVLMSSFNALAAHVSAPPETPSARERLVHGPAWGKSASEVRAAEGDWPAYRRDARRSGSIRTAVSAKPTLQWRVKLGSSLAPPVVAGGRLLIAEKDAHTVHALDLENGATKWSFTAGGRIDSPPTVHEALVLFGSTDGWVYCLRLEDGGEVWRFQAAPWERRIAAFGQVESAWPVHGSVLVQVDANLTPPRPVAYFTAGRSTFLDGGMQVYGLDPETGEVLHQLALNQPRSDPFQDEGAAGYMDGAKSDLLVSDGADLYLLQERFRSNLTRVPAPMQTFGKENGGAREYPAFPERGSSGVRLIASSGFLDDVYNEGTYWTYSQRWAGWDRKMRTVPSYGQLLVFDDEAVYGVSVFTESIRVRMGTFPGGKGNRLFARDHGAQEDRWSFFIPLMTRAMVAAEETLFVAGTPDLVPKNDPLAAIEGRLGAVLMAVSATDGEKLSETKLDAPPVFDGLIAARERLYLVTTDGAVLCFGK